MKPAGYGSQELAARVARDLQDGWCVNLGLGLPTLVAAHVADDTEVLFQTENGLLGIGDIAEPGQEDPDLVDASKHYTTIRPGASTFDSSMSFAMIRSGRLDLAILGGLQVSQRGDLASWYIPGGSPGVGGAMDLAVGARMVWVVMWHTNRSGSAKLLEECTYPLTGSGVVDRVYTNLGVFDVEDERLILTDCAPGVDLDTVREATPAPFESAVTFS